MKIHRLNVILKNISNYKYKRGFINYISSLSYDDFEYLLRYYMSALIRLMLRYKDRKANFLSKQWFINRKLILKYRKIGTIFYNANYDFCKKIDDNIQEDNKIKSELLNNIRENQNILNNLQTVQILITDMMDEKEIINFCSYIISVIYVKKELEKLYEELGKYIKSNQ